METTVPVERFPVEYAKVRYVFGGIGDRVGGVGFNVAAMLGALEIPVRLASLVGCDPMGEAVRARLALLERVDSRAVLPLLSGTPRSVNLVAPDGEAAFFTDLRESQEIRYPDDAAEALLDGVALLHATNINWALELADRARARGIPVSTDVHALSTLDDPYNRRFLERADIVFVSTERLAAEPPAVVDLFWKITPAKLVIFGMGARGAAVGERSTGRLTHLPATPLRPIRNATGCGDALAAGFLAAWLRGREAGECLRQGQRAAGWKIGAAPGDSGLADRSLVEGTDAPVNGA